MSKFYIELSNSGHEFTIQENNSYGAVPVDFKPEFGIPYFLLMATYQTGDTFQSSSGNEEIIFLYKDAAKAKEALDILKEHAKVYEELHGWSSKKKIKPDWFSEYSVEIPANEGVFKFSPPWNGYFERLEGIEIKTLFRKVD